MPKFYLVLVLSSTILITMKNWWVSSMTESELPIQNPKNFREVKYILGIMNNLLISSSCRMKSRVLITFWIYSFHLQDLHEYKLSPSIFLSETCLKKTPNKFKTSTAHHCVNHSQVIKNFLKREVSDVLCS